MSNSHILAVLVIATIPYTLSAQRPGTPVGSPYGNVLYPGGVPTAPRPVHPVNNFAFHPPQGGQFPHHGPVNGGNNRGNRAGKTRTIVVPYAYPVYVGGGYVNGYGNGYVNDPQYGQQQMQQQQEPPVIVNQTFIPDAAGNRMNEPDDFATRTNEPPPPPAPPLRQRPVSQVAENDDQATIYLIALKNGTVYTAIGYGVIANTLTYTAPNGSSSRVSMDDVDRSLSERLNHERNLQFNLGTQ